MTTNPNLDQAREWAKSNLDKGHFAYGGRVMAAAHVIASLPDEWIDAGELRDVINGQLSSYPHGTVGHHVAEDIACKLEVLFPDPQPRTLADMTAAEQEACRWMQAKIFHSASTVACVVDPGDFRSTILFQDGAASNVDNDQITPLPELPRMVWPDEQATEEDMSIIPPKIDTSTGHDDHVDMTPEDVPEGEAWLIRPYENADPTPAFRFHGSQYGPRKRWAHYVTGSSMLRFEDDENITLVSRLVPEEQA